MPTPTQKIMKHILLLHIDGRLPNLALMRIAAHHRALGDTVELRRGNPEPPLWADEPDAVYASCIFASSRPIAARVETIYPNAIIGGTGWDIGDTLEAHGITTQETDYSVYPEFRQSIGFTQRGCRLSCDFCVVPRKEGKVKAAQTITEIWRGEGHPRELILLDNDFFGQAQWRDRIAEIRDGKFKVSFTQGINARCLTDEAAEAIASVDYRNDKMDTRRIYTAWDSKGDEQRLFDGLNRLVKYGVKPDHIMVYMLCGFALDETEADREYRRVRLREFGARPYPMPFRRTRELIGFQRWVVAAYDKRISWGDWVANGYDPRGVGKNENQMRLIA